MPSFPDSDSWKFGSGSLSESLPGSPEWARKLGVLL
jgi:hypothetical protein